MFLCSLGLLAMVISTACRSASRHEPGEVILQAPIVSTAVLNESSLPDVSLPDTANADTQRLLKMVSISESAPMPIPNEDLASSTRPLVRHAGVAPDQFRDLTEDELLVLALNHSEVIRSLGVRVLSSPQSVTTRWDPAIRASDPFFGPAAALAEFDSQVSASLLSQNNDRVFNNATLGGDVQELIQDFAELNATWQKRNTYGTQFDVRSIQTYDSNNRTGNRFPSFWETQLELGVRQPLLRGAGREFNLIAGPNARPGLNFSNGIWIARINTKISQADFQIALRDYLMELYTAYWGLRQQYVVYENVAEARDVAYEIWKTVESKKLSGLVGGEAYKESQSRATYYRFQREVESALGGGNGASGLYVSERNLRRLIGLPPADRELLRPVDPPASARFEFDLSASVATAITHRTELCRQRLELQQKNLRLIAAKNFLLPQLDLIGRHRIRGFGDDLGGGGDRFDSAADDFYSGDHQEWQFGVETSVSPPLRQARAAVRNASLEIQRERAILLEQERAVAYEVEDAVAEIQSAYLTMQSSQHQVTASRQRLESSQALYDAGKLQLEFLIDATEQLVRAETQLAIDQSRYSLSLVRLSRTKGTLLNDLGLHPCE
ncbi:TolC family protein [Neorhodopirellula pilleata]|uniref:Outer membrane efflux protein n=1 Tax=Neorhodopirellula pilleata TaxID=2714738 RepID=A0A5C6AHM0_9BACT|nr:TolC family protein [Neorhodopirellula pilleata]TWT98916.1 Outer membrane efflux protein [Neorhodopirellula pilleata]